MESIVCLILARGGSKRIKNKNLCRINGTSLILRCLQTVTRVKGFSEVWVSTDSPEIEEESRQISCVKIHRRASYASLDSASSLCAVKEFLESHTGSRAAGNTFDEVGNEAVDLLDSLFKNKISITTLALVQCTSPFLRICDLDEACLKMSCPACDSVFSVKTDKALRWKTKDGISQPVNFNPAQRPRSQDMEAEFVETGGFYFFRTYLTERNLLQGPRAEMVIVPEELSIDIDTEIDLKLAQVLDENLGVMLL